MAELDGTITLLDGDSLSGWARPSRWSSPCRGSSHARTDARLCALLLGGVLASGSFVFPSHGWALSPGRRVVVRRGTLEMRYGHWLDVSPDGARAVVAAGYDGAQAGDRANVEVIDLSTAACRTGAEWRNPRSQVIFSPDGTRCCRRAPTACRRVDAGTGPPPRPSPCRWPSRRAAPSCPTAARTLPRLVHRDGLRLDLSTHSAVEFACRAVGRDLTREEWPRTSATCPTATYPVGLSSGVGWSPTSCEAGRCAPRTRTTGPRGRPGSRQRLPPGARDVHASTLRRPGIAANPPALPS